MSTEIKKQKYQCMQCNDVQELKLFAHETAPQVINCMQCGSGFKASLQQMVQQGIGMFPIMDNGEIIA